MAQKAEFCLLGPLTVRRDGIAVPVLPGKQRVVLAALLLARGRPVGTDELAEALWGAAVPASARASLQNYVARLRKALGDGGPAIVTGPGGYRMEAAPDDLDVARFEAAVAAGRAAARAGAWGPAAESLRGALALWRGDPLTGVPSELLAEREVPRLAELRLQALEARMESDLHLGRAGEVIAELRVLTAAEPLRERLHALLITALYQDGQQAGALAAYQAARTLLLTEVGAEPGPELRRLQRQVLAGELAVPAEPAPAAAGQPAEVRYSLPPDTAAFTGRDAELDRIAAAAGTGADPAAGGVVAIRAIDGMPGVGKTALAVHAAHLLRDRYPARQLFVDLRGHTPGQDPLSPEAALAGLLVAAGVDPRYLPPDLTGRAALWRDRMAGQRVLLVLDNAASSAQVLPLLPGGDHCLVLVTSRRHLADLPSAIVPVMLATLPPLKAREMFVRLAPRAAAGPSPAVAELMALAGFLPLAISLLARVYNRHPAWSLADLTAETRSRLLTLTAENDSVAAAFSVSYQHLDAAQQEFFRRLGLHPGTTIDAWAAAALAGRPRAEAAAALDALYGEGLLTETGYRRYGMHDLIRRYAGDRAAEDPPGVRAAAVGRLLDYYQDVAARADDLMARQPRRCARPPAGATAPPEQPGLPDRVRALAWVRAERANLLACLDYAGRTGQRARIVALTASIAAILRQDGPWADALARHAAAAAAAADLGDRPGEADALKNLGDLRRLTGDHPGAARAAARALALYRELDDRLGQANALTHLGDVRALTGDYPGAVQALDEALAISRDIGSRLGQANALDNLGALRRAAGDYPGAARILDEALGIFRDLGDRQGQASALSNLADVWQLTSDYRSAAQAAEEALGISRDIGNKLGQANAFNILGDVRRQTGDYRGAAQVLDEALAMFRDIGSRLGQAGALFYLGDVRRMTGDYPGAAAAQEEALRIYRDLGSRPGQANSLLYLGIVRRESGRHAEAAAALADALALFRELGSVPAQVEALNETGALHLARGDTGRAAHCHRQALGLAREIASPRDEAAALAGLARCALAAGDSAEAMAGLRRAQAIFERIGAAEAAVIAAELSALPARSSPGPPAGSPGRETDMTEVAPDVPQVPLGASGIQVSRMALGSWRTYERMTREAGVAVLRAAREAGITFLDDARYNDETGTAPIPTGYSEVVFGELFRAARWPRAEAVVANKLWWEFWPDETPAQELAGSLRRMQFDYLDLAYSEVPPDGVPLEDAVALLGELVRGGAVRAWGTLNWPPALMERAWRAAEQLGVPGPVATQPPYSLVRRDAVENPAMQELARSRAVAIVASYALAGGVLTGKYDADPAAGRAAGTLDRAPVAAAVAAGRELAALARATGRDPAPLAVAFALLNPAVTAVLFGATAPWQVTANLGALAVAAELTAGEREQLAAIGARPVS